MDIKSKWPYNWADTEKTLDYEEINTSGRSRLSRALNTRRVVGFIGSGLSAAYGRTTWYEVTHDHVRLLCTWLKVISQKPSSARFKSLKETLDEHNSTLKPTSSPQTLMVVMQLCEQVWREADPRKRSVDNGKPNDSVDSLAHHCGISKVLERFRLRQIPDKDLGREMFQFWVQEQTYDEAAFVRKIIYGNTNQDKDKPNGETSEAAELYKKLFNLSEHKSEDKNVIDNFKKALTPERELTRDLPENRPYLRFFQKETLKSLWGSLKVNVQIGVDKIDEAVEKHDCKGPSQFYVTGLALDLLRLTATPGAGIETIVSTILGSENHMSQSARADFVPPERDPLHKLDRLLKIRRFATTNWDLEIERYFSDLGYNNVSSDTLKGDHLSRTERVSPLVGRTREIVLELERPSDLIDLATNESDSLYQVAHLHGRATEDSSIIATERDYQSAYLRFTGERTIMRESVDVMFGGNPILFAGLGMSEDDLMRPLRQFLSNNIKRNRDFFALVNPTSKRSECKTWAMEIFARYGVHVLYYGDNSLSDLIGGDDDKSLPEGWANERWLFIFEQLIKDLRSALQEAQKEQNRAQEVETFESKFKTSSKKQKKRFNAYVLLLDSWQNGTFISDGHPCQLQSEATWLNIIIDIASNEIGLEMDNEKISALYKVLEKQLDRIKGAVLSTALCTHLDHVADIWTQWWDEWQTVPFPRGDQVAFGPPDTVLYKDTFEPKKTSWGPSESRVWSRHVIANTGSVIPSPLVPAKKKEFNPSKSFGVGRFLEAIENSTDFSYGLRNQARRVVIIAGEQGSGKGDFFSSLFPIPHKSDYHTHNIANKARSKRVFEALLGEHSNIKYSGVFFASFSFSHEVASIYDALLAFALNPTAAAEPRFAQRNASRAEGLHTRELGRLELLRQSFAKFKNQEDRADEKTDRRLIVLNAVDVMLDRNGYPKNGEIRDIFDFLLGEELEGLPFDLLLLVNSKRIPYFYRKEPHSTEPPTLQLIKDKEDEHSLVSEKVDPAILRRRFETLRNTVNTIITDNNLKVAPANRSRTLDTTAAYQVGGHYLYIVGNFDPESIIDPDSLTLVKLACGLLNNKPDMADFISCLIDQLGLLHRLLNQNRMLFTMTTEILNHRLVYLQPKSTTGLSEQEATLSEVTAYVSKIRHTVTSSGESSVNAVIQLMSQEWENFDASLVEENIPARLRDFFVALRQAIVTNLSIIGSPVVSDVLLLCPTVQSVLDNYNTFVEPNYLLALIKQHGIYSTKRRKALGESETGHEWLSVLRNSISNIQGNDDVTIQRGFIRFALGVLVERTIIFQVKQRYDKNPMASEEATDEQKDLRATELLFNDRFVIHRLVQSFISKRISRHGLAPADLNRFSVSVYASTVRDLPTIDAAHYVFLNELVESLVDYPDASRATRRSADIRRIIDAAHGLRAALGVLRSMFSLGIVLRFSDFKSLRSPDISQPGYLEHLRLILRWMIFSAQEQSRCPAGLSSFQKDFDAIRGLYTEIKGKHGGAIKLPNEVSRKLDRVMQRRENYLKSDKIKSFEDENFNKLEGILDETKLTNEGTYKKGGKTKNDESIENLIDAFEAVFRSDEIRKQSWAPFYRDEIMWLFNECGILSYTQGQIKDAGALLGMAEKVARSIEGKNGGPLTYRIGLNQGFQMLDSGKISAAQSYFKNIASQVASHEKEVKYIAQGGMYICALHSGKLDTILEPLEDLIQKLVGRNRDRSAAILALYRSIALLEMDDERADKQLERCIELATRTSAEDVMLQGWVAYAPRLIAQKDPRGARWLREAEDYAMQMDMPRLLADVMIAKARIQLDIGDLSASATFATRALRISTLLGLRLKKLDAMEIVGQINRLRNGSDCDHQQYDRTLRSARNIGYLLLIHRAGLRKNE